MTELTPLARLRWKRAELGLVRKRFEEVVERLDGLRKQGVPEIDAVLVDDAKMLVQRLGVRVDYLDAEVQREEDNLATAEMVRDSV